MIVCTQDWAEKKENEKKTETEFFGVNSNHLRDNYSIVCTPVCLLQMWYNIAHCNNITSHFVFHFFYSSSAIAITRTASDATLNADAARILPFLFLVLV